MYVRDIFYMYKLSCFKIENLVRKNLKFYLLSNISVLERSYYFP